jgi:hypothetical protein
VNVGVAVGVTVGV